MKKLLFGEVRFLNQDLALLIGRVSIALLMLVHGVPKMQLLFSGDTSMFPSVFGMTTTMSLALTVFAEVICSVLLLVGFATRFASIALAITMAVAVLYIHGNDEFAKKELGLLYLSAYLVILFAGSGKYAVDTVFVKK